MPIIIEDINQNMLGQPSLKWMEYIQGQEPLNVGEFYTLNEPDWSSSSHVRTYCFRMQTIFNSKFINKVSSLVLLRSKSHWVKQEISK